MTSTEPTPARVPTTVPTVVPEGAPGAAPAQGRDRTEVTGAEELVALLGEQHQRARDKGRDRLVEVDRQWLAASPFCVLATATADADADGRCDASPKGDPAGTLVHVIDDVTIAVAEQLDDHYRPENHERGLDA